MTESYTIAYDEAEKMYYLQGAINASLNLNELLNNPSQVIAINLKNVSQFNSIGVKNWIDLMRKLKLAGKTLEYHECSSVFSRLCNIVRPISDNAQIKSAYADYYCENCDSTISIYYTIVELKAQKLNPSPQICKECLKEMKLDVEWIFNFVPD